MDEVSSYARLNLPLSRRQGRAKDCSTSSSNPMMEGPWCRVRREARARERHRRWSWWIALKVLDPRRPIREADIALVTARWSALIVGGSLHRGLIGRMRHDLNGRMADEQARVTKRRWDRSGGGISSSCCQCKSGAGRHPRERADRISLGYR